MAMTWYFFFIHNYITNAIPIFHTLRLLLTSWLFLELRVILGNNFQISCFQLFHIRFSLFPIFSSWFSMFSTFS